MAMLTFVRPAYALKKVAIVGEKSRSNFPTNIEFDKDGKVINKDYKVINTKKKKKKPLASDKKKA